MMKAPVGLGRRSSKARIVLAAGVLAAVGSLSFASFGIAADRSFRGNFSADDDVQLFSFWTDGATAVVLRSYGYGGGLQADGTVISAGGFDPVLEVFNAEGLRVDGNDDGTDSEVATDPLTDSAFDVYLAPTLPTGTYTVAITEYNNHAIGPSLADGFSRTGAPTFTSEFLCPNGQFCDASGYDRTSLWAFDILGAEASAPPEISLMGETARGVLVVFLAVAVGVRSKSLADL